MNGDGRVAVVTGASGGIESEIVRSLADRGHRVIAVGRDERKLSELARAAGTVVWDAAAAP